MSDLEQRVKRIEDRTALYDVLMAYYTAVDTMSDVDGLVSTFTEDGIFDLTGLGLSRLQGKQAIGDFFKNAFAGVTHHAHHVSNFRVSRLTDDDATGRAYVIGRAKGLTGLDVFVSCFIDIDYVRTASGWKMKSFVEGSLMPLSGDVTQLHGDNKRLQ